MSILLAFLLIAAAQDRSGPVLRQAVPTARLNISDEIAPAVVPYIGCLLARDGIEVRGRHDPRPRGERPTDCSNARAEAFRQADAMLRRLDRRPESERHAFIERTLRSVDEFNGRAVPRPSQDSDQ